RRLAVPVAEKMGLSYEDMVEKMYENNSNGDWEEFADVAQRLHWVQHLVQEIREDGIRERPTSTRSFGFFFQMEEQVDGRGERYIQLPRLNPYDHWYLHNPDGYFRR
ncbi:MAG: hypothetical protein KDA28_14375, partial [Phycisphaerales bacterium]|nr:hypothetical protein [Phycisphaerales bacterium]